MHAIKNITITPEILKLMDIDEFKGRWKAMQTLVSGVKHSFRSTTIRIPDFV